MNETIREYLTRRVRWCMGLAIGGWLLVAVSMSSHIAAPVGPVVGAVMFGGAVLAMQWGLKCPRCSVRLGQVVVSMGIPRLKPQPNFCPYCGVSFDEPREAATAGIVPPLR